MNAQRQEVVPANSRFTPVPTGMLQRKCACGNHTMAGGECAECRKTRQSLQSSLSPSPRRGEGEVPPIVHEVLSSPGQPLDFATRAFMEPRFGHDFTDVRIHDNGRAAQSSRAVDADAYTVGADIAFGAGQYAPYTPQGRWLRAHE